VCRHVCKGHGERFDESSYDHEVYPGALQFLLEVPEWVLESQELALVMESQVLVLVLP